MKNEPHQINIEARKNLIGGKVVQEFILTEWDEDGVYGQITMTEIAARSTGKVLRNLSAPDPRLTPGQRIFVEFLRNPFRFTYCFFRELLRFS